eukprot:354880-Chlamydomonas_euryale.AAC.4
MLPSGKPHKPPTPAACRRVASRTSPPPLLNAAEWQAAQAPRPRSMLPSGAPHNSPPLHVAEWHATQCARIGRWRRRGLALQVRCVWGGGAPCKQHSLVPRSPRTRSLPT